jgi:hypothetical protein
MSGRRVGGRGQATPVVAHECSTSQPEDLSSVRTGRLVKRQQRLGSTSRGSTWLTRVEGRAAGCGTSAFLPGAAQEETDMGSNRGSWGAVF